jgi:hypothetical protein
MVPLSLIFIRLKPGFIPGFLGARNLDALMEELWSAGTLTQA